MADKYDDFLDAPDVAVGSTAPQDKYDTFLDAPDAAVTTPQARGSAVTVQPVVPKQTTAPTRQVPEYKPTVFENITGGIVEPIMKMGSATIAKPVSDVAGLGSLVARLFGVDGADPLTIKQNVQKAMTYEPRTAGGQSEYNPLNAIPEAIGKGVNAVTTPVMEALRGDAAADSARGMAANFVGEAVPQAIGLIGVKKVPAFQKNLNAPAVAQSAEQIAARTATKQAAKEAASNADWQRAATIEAAQKARTEGIVLNPSKVSESPRTIRMAAAGGNDHFNTAASIANKSKWNDMVRSDLGLPKNAQLEAATFDKVRKVIGKPYDDAASLGKLAPDQKVIGAIREIDIPEILPAGEVASGKMARTTDYVIGQIENGEMTGKMALDTTRTLRREAKQTFDSIKSGNRVPPIEVDAAKGKMRLAEKIDELVSSNISDPKWKASFDESRRKMALSYAYERATNLATRQVDPQVFAQEMQGRHYLTGNAAKMGEIAANFPEIANVYAERGKVFGMPVRSGVAGTTGFAVGSLYGAPVATSATFAGIANIGEKVYGKRLMSDAGQAKLATPVDRRLWTDLGEPK